jgi:glycosyltransferase involved in cell wall biosynthesis
MRLLIATGIFPPQIGGPATYSKLLYDELPKRGIDVDVANFGDYLHKPKLIRHILYFLEVLKKAQNADVVYAQDPVSAGLPALLAAEICRKRFFIRVAGDYAWEQATQRFGVRDTIDDFQSKKYGRRTEFLRSIQRFVVDGAHKVVTPSDYFRTLVSAWCKTPEKVATIYNGIEELGDVPSKAEARKILGIGRLDKVLVSSGRLVPWKGFELLVKLVAEWKRDGRKAKLFIIGDGPDKERLRALIAAEGVREEVELVGSAPRSAALRYVAAADAYILNTAFESFSFAVVEAMRAGTPVVSTSVGSIPELIETGEEGLLVPYNDKAALKFAVECVLADGTLRRDLAKAAKKKSLRFSIESTIDGLIKLL